MFTVQGSSFSRVEFGNQLVISKRLRYRGGGGGSVDRLWGKLFRRGKQTSLARRDLLILNKKICLILLAILATDTDCAIQR